MEVFVLKSQSDAPLPPEVLILNRREHLFEKKSQRHMETKSRISPTKLFCLSVQLQQHIQQVSAHLVLPFPKGVKI